jgi:hypothetical protein
MREEQIQWLGTPEARIISIRKFRNYINSLEFKDAVAITKEKWESGPYINKSYFNIYNIEEWPTPWNLFGQSVYCKNSQLLGIFYTLIMSKHSKHHNIKLVISKDIIYGENVLIICDDELNEKLNISAVFTSEDIKSKLGDE